MSESSKGTEIVESNIVKKCPTDLNDENDVLCLAEGVPAWLQALVRTIPPSGYYEHECFIAALYVLLHEAGFSADGVADNPSRSFDVRILRSLTPGGVARTDPSMYQLNLRLHACPHLCNLVIVPTGNISIVNFLIPNKPYSSSCTSFDITTYVSLDDSALSFKNLDALSVKFKNICHRMQNLMLQMADLPTISLNDLPYEVLYFMCTYLNPKSFVTFSTTCKKFHTSLYNDEQMWKRMFKLHFKSDCGPSSNCSWKKHYINQSKQKFKKCLTIPYTPQLYYMRPLGYCNVRL